MNRFLLSLLLCLAATLASAQTPTVHWANTPVTDGSEFISGIAVDAAGNSVIVGYSQATNIAFGRVSFTNTGPAFTYLSYIVKYDSLGNLLWATRVTGTNSVITTGVTLDTSGNVFVAGQFTGTASFGANSLTTFGQYDAFIAKYDTNGNALWARPAGGTGTDVGYSVATDTTGNCYLSGNFTTNLIIGPFASIAAA